MLQGCNYPLTPKGKSTLNPPPPWYYSADFLNIEFWSQPSAVAALLPTGLDPDPPANRTASLDMVGLHHQLESGRQPPDPFRQATSTTCTPGKLNIMSTRAQ